MYYEDYQITGISFSAGTPGTRGYQTSFDNQHMTDYTVGYFITYISDSSAILPLIFLSGTKIYVNAYRANSSAVSNAGVYFRLLYMKR